MNPKLKRNLSLSQKGLIKSIISSEYLLFNNLLMANGDIPLNKFKTQVKYFLPKRRIFFLEVLYRIQLLALLGIKI